MTDPIQAAAALLREHGWTCTPPVDPNAAIPEPQIGQVWRSLNPRIEPRTVVWIGACRSYPWAGDKCVGFTTPIRQPDLKFGAAKLSLETWRVWVKKSAARPEISND